MDSKAGHSSQGDFLLRRTLYLLEDVLSLAFAHSPRFADVVEEVDSGFGTFHHEDEGIHAFVPVFEADYTRVTVNSEKKC